MNFEQLIESRLQQAAPPPTAKSPQQPVKTAFLRKGQGIARFGMRKFRLKSRKMHGKENTDVGPLPQTNAKKPPPSPSLQREAVESRDLGRGWESLSDSNESIPQVSPAFQCQYQ